MERGDMLNTTLHLVTTKFNGVCDRGGAPYVLHCLTVMHNLDSEDEELQCMALGHDLIEDTDVTADLLRELDFTERVIAGIESVTKIEGESPEAYLAKVKANPDGIRVKLADLKHNSDVRRLGEVTDKDRERLAKYRRMTEALGGLGRVGR